MDVTKNLKLRKPSYDDPVDIADLNENADIIDQALNLKADKTEIPTTLPANGGNADTVGGVAVVTTASLGLHKLASGTATATTSNCPLGAWYGKYE